MLPSLHSRSGVCSRGLKSASSGHAPVHAACCCQVMLDAGGQAPLGAEMYRDPEAFGFPREDRQATGHGSTASVIQVLGHDMTWTSIGQDFHRREQLRGATAQALTVTHPVSALVPGQEESNDSLQTGTDFPLSRTGTPLAQFLAGNRQCRALAGPLHQPRGLTGAEPSSRQSLLRSHGLEGRPQILTRRWIETSSSLDGIFQP